MIKNLLPTLKYQNSRTEQIVNNKLMIRESEDIIYNLFLQWDPTDLFAYTNRHCYGVPIF